MKTRYIIINVMMLLAATVAQAQINIQGKVFGGARQANVGGHTFVHIGADKHDAVINYVFGGNDISGTIGSSGNPESSDKVPSVLSKATENGVNNSWNAFVKISAKTNSNGTEASDAKKIYIGQLFGGGFGDYPYKNETYVGGNKKYDVDIDYTAWLPAQNQYGTSTHEIKGIDKPDLLRTYLEITGGSIVYAYGGGNNVTVTDKTVICVDNPSAVVNSIKVKNSDGTDSDTELLTNDRFVAMGINIISSHPSSDEFQIGRLFGGNNKAEMAIRPMWNLQQGKIRDLYSGGNEGAMTSPVGLLLEINPKVPDGLTYEEAKIIKDKLKIDNVYGGCRKADVHPKLETGEDPHTLDIQLPDKDEQGNDKYKFPAGLSARVLVYGGDVNNVYGGNDVAGRVYGGNAVGVYSSIRGSVYGGGNGSYPYTDNDALIASPYGDFYYNPDIIADKERESNSSFAYTPGFESVEALNLYRPNAEQVSLRVKGNDALHPTIIGGSIYVGGNSATLRTTRTDALAQLKIGSYVIAENVFLGNNGENMIKYENEEDVLNLYSKYVKVGEDGSVDYKDSETAGYTKFNSMILTDVETFAKYMDGCAISISPNVVFDKTPDDPDDYEDYSTYFGSFYCGGNVGSITKPGKLTIDFDKSVVVYDKVVGGCNNAYVLPREGFNAPYQGGIIGSEDERPTSLAGEPRYTDTSNHIKDRLELNFNGLKIQPMRMPIEGVDKNGDNYVNGVSLSTNEKYLPMVWNTIKLGMREDGKPVPVAWSDNEWYGDGDGHDAEYNSIVNRRFTGGNIYGGCCESGVVNGNVVININASIVDRLGEHGVFDILPTNDETGEDKLYNNAYDFNGHETVSGVILGQQGMDVLGSALNVFGGGKGVETEIWGSATINLKRGYVFQIFGGSEHGAIGKRKATITNGETAYDTDAFGKYKYEYNSNYSTFVNLTGSASHQGKPKSQDMSEDIAEAEFLYGGGFEGPIAGNTCINLDNGRIFNSFAGSCNADIQGHTETIIGANGFPYVRDYVYGGNDLGGKILGSGDCNFTGRVRTQDNDGYDAIGKVYNKAMLNASAYTEYIQGRVEKIFGGCYGVYDYTDPLYGDYFYATDATDTDDDNLGTARPGFSKPFLGNAFINFRPTESNNPLNSVGQIYGAGQGYFTEKEENLMQNSSYILIDVPKDMTAFQGTEVFGGGECGGVGMGVNQTIASDPAKAHQASAIIDLARGYFKAVYGGSYQEGITRRTVVNVPEGSTFHCNRIFGGAYGRIDVETRIKQENGQDVLDEDGNPVLEIVNETPRIDVACDVYEAIVNYNSADATIDFALYGGNNACRRTLYSQVNINTPVKGGNHWTGLVNIYGAGKGVNTWSQYTEVNLNEGARIQEAYGGGEDGQVLNLESVSKWQTDLGKDANGKDKLFLGLEGYSDYGFGDSEHPTPANSNRLYEVDDTRPQYYNTNVHINKGATVTRYCYGGGLGHGDIAHSGNVYGTTYIDLLGGTVDYDLYAAGTTGSVKDSLGVKGSFVASSTAYIEGGMVRNVYGGGWAGTVGQHDGVPAIRKNKKGEDENYTNYIITPYTNDIYGETHVVIGIDKDHLPTSDGTPDFYYYHGIPTITRNAYGGGEGGAVWGTAHLTMLNGYIGYQYDASKSDVTDTPDFDERYVEKIEDDTYRDNDGHFLSNKRLNDAGCIFGGGYIDNSSVDVTDVKVYNGHVRNALFGGGEIAAIGRGVVTVDLTDETKRHLEGIYKAGSTTVELFDGHIHRNVFGGGRGYNNLGEGGSLFSDGYVFGHTEVHIHGGEVGTTEEVLNANGNVFGGGDIGYVYSAHENEGVFSVGIKDGNRYDDGYEGYYYKYDLSPGKIYEGEDAESMATANKGSWDMDGDEFILTEDCKVLIEPHCKVLTACTINGTQYAVGQYVKTEDLSALGNKNETTLWSNLDLKGIIIHNAVFAGGNTTKGATISTAFANTTSVYGNATASIHDVYNRDLITLGSGRIGGLYGDGNLTLVDGYRGLNITNYGTDYYTISTNMQISIDDYNDDSKYNDRERAYYQLTYICEQECTDDEGTTYYPKDNNHSQASTLTSGEIQTLFKDGTNTSGVVDANGNISTTYWKLNGVCTIYAGRPMNTIQRADFCGVFGSRMVMQGAEDRLLETPDYKRYTINRVREVSLNKKKHKIGDIESNTDFHGNYFGIYSKVNYLGALTSDMDFHDAVRVTDNRDVGTYKKTITIDGHDYVYGEATYEQWKQANRSNRTRNNGNSHNKVALASGVYLELTSERSTGDDLYEKDWGPITGVVELDLINVQTGIGGGFVYAKNIHGKRSPSGKTHVTLTALNRGAVTSDDFNYAAPTTPDEWESSGNFVHGEQIIIDDCYNVSSKYMGADAVPAHYWYIQGSVYVYDQYISVYAGVPNAYSETVDIPLTITAASHGTMKLLDVQPCLYAYYSSNGVDRLGENQKLNINGVNYQLNDSISYWDWFKLTKTEQKLFVKETYVVVEDCWIEGTEYKKGYVLLKNEYDNLSTKSVIQKKKNEQGVIENVEVEFSKMFRSSNNVSHNTGYILTYKMNNPTEWDTWYTVRNGVWNNKDQAGGVEYEDGPTYHLKSGSGEVLGQREYSVGNLISKDVYDTYQAIVNKPANGQAEFEEAWIVTQQIDVPGTTSHYYPGATLSNTEHSESYCTGKVTEAYICTRTIQISNTEFIYINSKMTLDEKNAYLTSVNSRISAIAGSAITSMSDLTNEQLAALSFEETKELKMLLQAKKDIDKLITKAYYCKTAGLYGGDYYESGKNYRGMAAWSGMSPADREKFEFNYDALDLLIDPYYSMNPDNPTAVLHPEGMKYQYDSSTDDLTGAQANPAGYSLERHVNYTATYNGTADLYYTPDEGGDPVNAKDPEHPEYKELSRNEFERLPNEQRHYSSVDVDNTDATYYVVKKPVTIANKPYAVGTTITSEEFGKLSADDKADRIAQLTFENTGTYYFCRESYEIGENGEGVSVTSATGVTGGTGGSYDEDDTVPVGVVIPASNYAALSNKQLNFTIHGIAPTEISTLYVSRNSDIDDLSRGKIITVIYQYDYEESDESGQHITPITERHVVNIHIYFKSGSPTVEDIDEPPLILPGNLLGMREPNVIPGATEVTGGGWKLFEKESDAESHTNGIEYTPNVDPLFWYQDGYWLEYYAKSYIGGETYSNKVKIKVANYHDLTDVMDDKDHHYYVDIPDIQRLGRVPKIYINDASNGIQQLKDLFDLSLLTATPTGSLAGHALLNPQVNSCQNLEFFMRTNIHVPSGSPTWVPIANGDGECFEGNLHGDGHYISGLNNSLFGHLCGNVYNLGVMGSFNSAGVADTGTGYVENCWIKTTGTPDGTVRAVLGTPTATSGTKQIVNCYYPQAPEGATTYYSTTDIDDHGLARPMSTNAFHNGTVAYDLNGFYLFKRYWDKQSGTTGTEYKYYIPEIVDQTTGNLVPQTEYYGNNITYCSSGYNGEKYVEDRFADGDFRYAGGSIPDNVDERLYVDPTDNNKSKYYPIWPDDYLFFGQMLTYGWNDASPHEEVPSPIVKSLGRLPTSNINNRVYRAPAYYRSSTMDVAHFNPNVNLVSHSKPKNSADTDLHPAYPDMTAIDFAGHNDIDVENAYKLGLNGDWFYQPLLDDDGLQSIVNTNETPNLLVYAPAETAASEGAYANEKTYTVLTDYFKEPAYTTYYKGGNYRCVEAAPTQTIFGHLVQHDLNATNDHLLVDKQDFYCPINYSFIHDSGEDTNDGTHMWYQRVPENYVESVWSGSNRTTKGWEAISLPFAAELVTTVKKGEITHFYSGSESSKNNTNTKLGHEYWLREYRDISAITEVPALNEAKAEALFTYPKATDSWEEKMTKITKNSFLWDYYYNNSNALDGNEHKDANLDTYQTYYQPKDDNGVVNTFTDYTLLSNAVPYIVGFPGKTFYEFDLSGNFYAETTAEENPEILPEQTITFVSADGYRVRKSNEEETEMISYMTHNGYVFKPSYLNNPKLETGKHAFLLSADGSRYTEDVTNTTEAKVTAFRSYFTGPVTSGARPVTRSIVFSNDDSEMKGVIEHGDPTKEEASGTLNIYAKKHKIIVESALSYTTDVRIVNLAGMTVNVFTIEPGETVETRINTSGVYIVQPSEARFIKKLAVR